LREGAYLVNRHRACFRCVYSRVKQLWWGDEVFVAGSVLKCRRERKWAVGGASVPRVGKRLCPGGKVLWARVRSCDYYLRMTVMVQVMAHSVPYSFSPAGTPL
jgi:hypothetical protein